ASCVSAIEAARDVVADIGQEAASASSGLTDLAGCGITNSERDCQRVFAKKYSLSVPIPFSYLKTESGQEIPLLKLRHWVEYLDDYRFGELLHFACMVMKAVGVVERKSDYATKDTEGNFDLVLQKAAEEACYMCNVGVMDASGQKYNAVLLNVIGDWPFLKKSGPFQRSFMSVQKKKTTRNPPGGVCHQCLAGVAPWAWEQIGTRRPDWIATVATQSPFDGPSALASVPHVANRLEMMWAWDWFHCWHLGVGKCFLASSIALLSERENGSSIDERFASLTERYHSWCRANGQRRQVVKLSKDLVGWPSTNVFPTGIWHKGQLTTSLMAWLEAECSASDFSDDPFLQAVSEATGAIQNCIRQMYHEVIFLTPAKAERIANEGMRFLRRYLSLADMSKRPALQRTMERYLMSVYHEFEK
ncbi:Uncharacterized protein SCF082_LOCUS27263, partial [Durusdinium trenchii]